MITFENAFYSWFIFWIFYWISGTFLTWKAHNEDLVVITKLDIVIQVLFVNMIWTFFGTVIIFYLPLKIIVENYILNFILSFNFVKFILCMFITDFWFFHIHAMCHCSFLYKKIHAKHHEFNNENMYALVGMYSSGYESIVCNLFSASIGPIILELDTLYLYIWFALVGINSTFSHSGFTYGWLFDGTHGEHHKSRKNLGTMTLFDTLYGTYKKPTPKPSSDLQIIDRQKIGELIQPKLENKSVYFNL